MDDIRRLLALARHRLETGRYLGWLHRVALIAAPLVLVIALLDRVGARPVVPWAWVAPAAAALVAGIALAGWSRRRPDDVTVAMAVDERLDLRERLTVALEVDGWDDPFAQAAVADAVRVARDPRSREAVTRRFRPEPPRGWWIAPSFVAIAVGVLLLPQADLFAKEEVIDEAALRATEDEVAQRVEAIVATAEQMPELQEAISEMLEQMKEAETSDPDQPRTPEEIRREAIKKVTELNRRLEDLMGGEEGQTLRSLEHMMSKIDAPDRAETKALADALKRGDFEAAKDALEKMASEAGNLSPEQREQLAAAMKQVAEQVKQAAASQAALEQALQQAGLDPQLASSPQALQQAIEQAQHLTGDQKQQLQQMMQGQQAAQSMAQSLAQAMADAAQSMAQGQDGQDGMQQAGDQLSQMEQLQMLMQQAQAMAGQCQGQCQGLGQGLGDPEMMGSGMGREGMGAGGKAPIAPTPFRTKFQKENVPITEGQIIARTLIEGEPVLGESKARLVEVVRRQAAGFDEAMDAQALPRRYHDAQKHYFGELEALVRAMREAGKSGDAGDAGETGKGGEAGGDDGGSADAPESGGGGGS